MYTSNRSSIDRIDCIDPIDPIDCINCIDHIDRIDRIDRIDCINCIDRIDRIDCIDRIDPIDRIDCINPIDCRSYRCYRLYRSCRLYIFRSQDICIPLYNIGENMDGRNEYPLLSKLYPAFGVRVADSPSLPPSIYYCIIHAEHLNAFDFKGQVSRVFVYFYGYFFAHFAEICLHC